MKSLKNVFITVIEIEYVAWKTCFYLKIIILVLFVQFFVLVFFHYKKLLQDK